MTRSFDEPLYKGELQESANLTLAAILRLLLAVLPVLVAVAWYDADYDKTVPHGFLLLCVALAFVLVLYFLQQRGLFAFCVHALVFGFITLSIVALGLYGSVRAPASVVLVGAITFGGIFLGRRALLLATLLSVIGLGGVIYAQSAGWLRVPDYRVSVAIWLVYAGVIIAVALALLYMRSLLLDLVRQLRGELAERKHAEEELRGNRRLLETVIDAIPMSIFAKDVNSNYIMLNRRMAEFFGTPKEEILRRHTSRLPIPDTTRTKSLEDDKWVFRNLRTLDQPETLLAGSDGAQIPYHSTKIPLLDEVGKLIGLLGINRDITEDKRAQEALRNSEHRYRSLFQTAMDCIVVISPSGAVADINSFACRTLGYAPEELLGGSFARILDQSRLARLLPRPPQVQIERRSLRAEQDMRTKDGGTRTVEFTAGPLPDGNILLVARDVTERRRNEKLLENIAKGVGSQTGAEFFRTLVLALGRELPADTVFIGETVATGDRVRTIACCVDGALAANFEYMLAGSPCSTTMDRRGAVVHPQGVAEQFPEAAALVRGGIVGYAGTSLFSAEGNAIGVLVALTRQPIEREEFVVSMLEIFAARAAAEIERARADATVRELNVSLERRVRDRTAELETANRDLDSFGYSVSHDLRSPLGALNGFAYLLRTRESARLSADGVHLLQQVEANATRMANLVEGLLEFSRLGRRPVTRIVVPMAALVHEVVDEQSAAIRDRRVDFRIGTIDEAWGDPMLLRQVWRNLIGNALKYSRGRDPAVVEVGCQPGTGEYFVRDNGAGFDMQYAGRLFGVFERLHSESEFEGTGVGLAIVQRIVQRHGGVVRGEGELDRGAIFRFTLPGR